MKKRMWIFVLIGVTLLAGNSLAKLVFHNAQEQRAYSLKNMKPAWRGCSQDSECDAFEAGCYYWLPVNKWYLKEATLELNKNRVCEKSIPEGPKPIIACIDHKCNIAQDPKN